MSSGVCFANLKCCYEGGLWNAPRERETSTDRTKAKLGEKHGKRSKTEAAFQAIGCRLPLAEFSAGAHRQSLRGQEWKETLRMCFTRNIGARTETVWKLADSKRSVYKKDKERSSREKSQRTGEV